MKPEQPKNKKKPLKKGQKIALYTAVIGLIGAVIAAIITAIASVMAPIISGKLQENGEEDSESVPEGDEDKNYIFNNIEERMEGKDGFSYVECHISIEPVSSCYKIMVYPYLECEINQENLYVLLEGLYTQEQYISDQEGTCLLKREDVTEDLEKAFIEEIDCDESCVKSGCLVVIEYYDADKAKRGYYVLKSGQLEKAEIDLIEKVIVNSLNSEIKTFNVKGWPCNRLKIKEII